MSLREGVDLQEETLHARVVIGVLTEAVSRGARYKTFVSSSRLRSLQLFHVAHEGDLPQIRT